MSDRRKRETKRIDLDALEDMLPVLRWFLQHEYELTITPLTDGFRVAILPIERLPRTRP